MDTEDDQLGSGIGLRVAHPLKKLSTAFLLDGWFVVVVKIRGLTCSVKRVCFS